jgi:hypothetical protein
LPKEIRLLLGTEFGLHIVIQMRGSHNNSLEVVRNPEEKVENNWHRSRPL